MLPSYAGLWPIFHAYINDEKFVGVTVHIMNNKVDSGNILYQKEIPIKKDDTIFSLYMKSFDISAKAIILALENLNNTMTPKNQKSSYYSFPKKVIGNYFAQKEVSSYKCQILNKKLY